MALNLRQEKAIDALLAAKNVKAASELCGVPLRTLTTWRTENAEFIGELERRRRELSESAFTALQKHMLTAIETIVEILRDKTAQDYARLQAARTLLETGLRAFEQLDVAARLDAVERMRDLYRPYIAIEQSDGTWSIGKATGLTREELNEIARNSPVIVIAWRLDGDIAKIDENGREY